MTNFTDVKKFMETFGQEVKNKAEFPSDKTVKLRYDLIKEELDEFEDALKTKNLNKCFEEVQNSNMSKLGQDGKPIYNESGKVMKGPNYFKPNLKKFL